MTVGWVQLPPTQPSSTPSAVTMALAPALAEADAIGHLLLGTGARQRFPHPSLLRPLASARIGFEVMDTHAACRTYSILVSEGRKVAAALFVA